MATKFDHNGITFNGEDSKRFTRAAKAVTALGKATDVADITAGAAAATYYGAAHDQLGKVSRAAWVAFATDALGMSDATAKQIGSAVAKLAKAGMTYADMVAAADSGESLRMMAYPPKVATPTDADAGESDAGESDAGESAPKAEARSAQTIVADVTADLERVLAMVTSAGAKIDRDTMSSFFNVAERLVKATAPKGVKVRKGGSTASAGTRSMSRAADANI